MEFPKIYKDKDADIKLINDQQIGIIGFGNQGKAQALNLKDSGVDVCVGIREDSDSMSKVGDITMANIIRPFLSKKFCKLF